MRAILVTIILIIFHSCANIEFVYSDKKNLINPLYDKTKVDISGFDIAFLKSYIPMFFGNKNKEEFYLSVSVNERQIKSSVETNQAISNLRYELRFTYELKRVDKNCIVFKKEVLSSFSITPKSSGFNFGTDTSLEKKYELAATKNIDQFISYLYNVDLKQCI